MIQDMPDEHKILEPQYLEAFSYFADIDLPVDLLVKWSQLPSVLELLKQVPVRGVIDHLAKPDIKNGTMEPWKNWMEQIAQYPHIFCKLSGMVTEADHTNWTKEDFIPYIHHIVQVFGMERIMFGSDWPVCLLAAGYDEVYHLLKEVLPGNLSEEDEAKIYGGNAMKFYQLG